MSVLQMGCVMITFDDFEERVLFKKYGILKCSLAVAFVVWLVIQFIFYPVPAHSVREWNISLSHTIGNPWDYGLSSTNLIAQKNLPDGMICLAYRPTTDEYEVAALSKSLIFPAYYVDGTAIFHFGESSRISLKHSAYEVSFDNGELIVKPASGVTVVPYFLDIITYFVLALSCFFLIFLLRTLLWYDGEDERVKKRIREKKLRGAERSDEREE